MIGTLSPDARELYLRSKATRDHHLRLARRFGNTVKGRRHINEALIAARIGNAMLDIYRRTAR